MTTSVKTAVTAQSNASGNSEYIQRRMVALKTFAEAITVMWDVEHAINKLNNLNHPESDRKIAMDKLAVRALKVNKQIAQIRKQLLRLNQSTTPTNW